MEHFKWPPKKDKYLIYDAKDPKINDAFVIQVYDNDKSIPKDSGKEK